MKKTPKTNPTVLTNGKKLLTKEIMEYDLKNPKGRIDKYLFLIFGIMVYVGAAYYVNPIFYLGLITIPFTLIKDIKAAIKRHKLQYYWVESICKSKEYCNRRHEWQLWFTYPGTNYLTWMVVSENVYEQVELEDEVYLVFFKGESAPCLYYSKKEWEWNESK